MRLRVRDEGYPAITLEAMCTSFELVMTSVCYNKMSFVQIAKSKTEQGIGK